MTTQGILPLLEKDVTRPTTLQDDLRKDRVRRRSETSSRRRAAGSTSGKAAGTVTRSTSDRSIVTRTSGVRSRRPARSATTFPRCSGPGASDRSCRARAIGGPTSGTTRTTGIRVSTEPDSMMPSFTWLYADDGEHDRKVAAFLAKYDTNHDGRVTKSELDKNGDGVVTPDELPPDWKELDVWPVNADGTVGDGIIDMHDYGPVPTARDAGGRGLPSEDRHGDRRLARLGAVADEPSSGADRAAGAAPGPRQGGLRAEVRRLPRQVRQRASDEGRQGFQQLQRRVPLPRPAASQFHARGLQEPHDPVRGPAAGRGPLPHDHEGNPEGSDHAGLGQRRRRPHALRAGPLGSGGLREDLLRPLPEGRGSAADRHSRSLLSRARRPHPPTWSARGSSCTGSSSAGPATGSAGKATAHRPTRWSTTSRSRSVPSTSPPATSSSATRRPTSTEPSTRA